MKALRVLFPIVMALVTLALTGCKSNEDEENLDMANFFLEASPNLPAAWMQKVTLPVSETEIPLSPRPFLTQASITNVELVKLDLGLALMFEFDRAGGVTLYQATAANIGRRVVLTINDIPVGVRMVDGPITQPGFIIYTELDDEELEEAVLGLRETTEKFNKRKKKLGYN